MNKKIISFPSLANYDIPIKFLLEHLTNHEIRKPISITKKTLELGSKYSPDYVCLPFKYNLGNFIESLEDGANVLIQAGGGCRFGYYSELQKQILEDLGYKFEFYTLTDSDVNGIRSLYKTIKKSELKLSKLKFLYYVLLTFLMIFFMDKMDVMIRKNIGFEINKGNYERTHKAMLKSFSHAKGYIDLVRKYFLYKRRFKDIVLDKPKNPIKIGVVGELYTSMEQFSSYYIEKELSNMNIEVTRFTDATFLLFTKRLKEKRYLRIIKDYCRYTLGADGMDNIARTKILIDKGYDGIIHIKPFGCTPEIGAMKILQNLCQDENIPLMFMTFDTETSEIGIKTRLEAFYDMIQMRRNNNE